MLMVLYFQKIKTFHDNPRVIRVMPNTPALVNEGCTGKCLHSDIDTIA